MSTSNTSFNATLAGLLSGHALSQYIARTGLPPRKVARAALLKILAQSGSPDHLPEPPVDTVLDPDSELSEKTSLERLSILVFAAFRPEWIKSFPEGLSYYSNHPKAWKRDILRPYRVWISDGL